MSLDGSAKGPGRESLRIRRLRQHLYDLRKRLPADRRLKDGLEHALMSTVAALAAYLPTQLLGLREGFWAAITAIAVLQSELGATRTTARDQFVGAAIGGVIGVGVVLGTGQHVVSYALAAGLSVLCAWLVNVASAARLAGVTATIILLVPHPGATVGQMALSRFVEVSWGVAVAVAVVWLAERLDPRRE